ncbi:hypothetical protein H4P12_07235 [Paracoccus sp. 11-3]|uniref:Thiol:disulfide interchange protein DsbD N-terminal domain-containing protein n=1 Tax=Paracoccus amoyensis TaxID=2760093 RepID=A0A926G643_9RHOB|nr:protein-disulfide reductase DsbD domain-containing protein [Paracoccus amoyensis]MBC9246508.1 hypothetical protein [Paracoccus amoyensis]
MKHAGIPLIAAISLALPAFAQDMPPGLTSARMLPGWTDADGNRIAAIELTLQPGWKTYWRSPGDSGLPPSFDWSGSDNLAEVTFHWPAPEAIRSGDSLTMGYHDRLVLPFTATPKDAGKPVGLSAQMDFGLCENICVPAHVSLRADQPADSPDPMIEAVLLDVPQPVQQLLSCRVQDISDGIRVQVSLPDNQIEIAAIELTNQPDIWVSGTVIENSEGGQIAVADFVPESSAPFPLDTDSLRITVIGPAGASEIQGCQPES